MRRFKDLKKVGKGSYGTVYRGKDTVENGETVAIKRISLKDELAGVPGSTLREISILKVLGDHVNCVKLKHVFHVETSLFLVFEYIENDLRALMDEEKKMTPKMIQSYSKQLLQGLDWLHSNGILHRDLKPSNVLIDTDKKSLKICDFGLARLIGTSPSTYTAEVVTLWYRAPEVLICSGNYSYPIDIWAWACIFVEMCAKKPLFTGEDEISLLQEIYRVLGTPTRIYWPNSEQCLRDLKVEGRHFDKQDFSPKLPGVNKNAVDLVERVLQYSAIERPTARQALEHSYFKLVYK
jgi:cyclin-dependent kinase 2